MSWVLKHVASNLHDIGLESAIASATDSSRLHTSWGAHDSTDEIGLRAVEKPVHVRDFHATILHLMGLDHERLTYWLAGLDFRLTGVEEAKVVKEICE